MVKNIPANGPGAGALRSVCGALTFSGGGDTFPEYTAGGGSAFSGLAADKIFTAVFEDAGAGDFTSLF